MSRFRNLDCLKALAMFAVLVIHAPGSDVTRSTAWQFFDQFCRFAVPCFFLASGFFFARSFEKAEDKRAVIVRYLTRLVPLFLFWAFFYAVMPPRGNDPPYNTPVLGERLAYIFRHPKAFALSGDIFHLWFLSALIQAICIVWLCLAARRPWLAPVVGAVLYGVALLGSDYQGIGHFPARFGAIFGPFYSVFCATLFVALGAMVALYHWRLGVGAAAALALAGLAIHWTEAWLLHDPAHGVGIAIHSFLLGTLPFATGIFFLALALPDTGPRSLAWAGNYSLGIYVTHVYVARILGLLPTFRALVAAPLVYISILYLASLLVSVALGRWTYTRRLVA